MQAVARAMEIAEIEIAEIEIAEIEKMVGDWVQFERGCLWYE